MNVFILGEKKHCCGRVTVLYPLPSYRRDRYYMFLRFHIAID